MPIDPEDPRLTAYALGELEDDEKADLEHDLSESDEGRRVVDEVGLPVNVLLLGDLTVGDLAQVGVRRVSVGGSLAWVAYGAMVAAATALRDTGMIPKGSPSLDRPLAAAAFAPRGLS